MFNGPFICRQNYDFWNRFHHESGWIGEEKDSHYMISNWVVGLIVSRSKAVEAAFHHLKGELSRARVLVCGKKKKRKSSGRKKKYKRADELSADSTSPNSANNSQNCRFRFWLRRQLSRLHTAYFFSIAFGRSRIYGRVETCVMTDRRRINGPSGGTRPPVFASSIESTTTTAERPQRQRQPNELRKICMDT